MDAADAVVEAARRVLTGIDRDEVTAPDGWWETSVGAGFGAQKLAELEEAIRDILV